MTGKGIDFFVTVGAACLFLIGIFGTVGVACCFNFEKVQKHRRLLKFSYKLAISVIIILCYCKSFDIINAKDRATVVEVTDGFDVSAHVRPTKSYRNNGGTADLMYYVNYDGKTYEIDSSDVKVGEKTVLRFIESEYYSPEIKLILTPSVINSVELKSETITIK